MRRSIWRSGGTDMDHTVVLEHPLYGMLPWFKDWTGTGEQPQSGDTTTVKQVGPYLRAVATADGRLERRGPVDGEHRDGRVGRSAERILPRPVAVLVWRHDFRAALQRGRRSGADFAYAAACAVRIPGCSPSNAAGHARRRRWSLILAAAGIAVLPLAWRGTSCGHDFDFHLESWMEVLRQWRQGVVYPHWAASANYGAGEPRFVFYPPLSWMLGALLSLVMPWIRVPLVFT